MLVSRARCCSTVRTSTVRVSTRSACVRPSAWCFSGQTRSPPCRFATTSWLGSGCRACVAARRSTRSPSVRCAAANLWNEVKDRLDKPGGGLSGGQQQRLCIARAIAVQPDVLLMDEPCSALDPISTLAIEDLIAELKTDYTIVIVTHNMQQAARVSDQTAFFNLETTGKPGGWSRSTTPRRCSPTLDRRRPRTTSPAGSANARRYARHAGGRQPA